MAVSGSVVGRGTQVYFKQGATWGTEATGGGEMHILEEGMEFSQELEGIEESNKPWMTGMDLGVKSAAVNFRQNGSFDDIRGAAFALGADGYATPVEVNAGKGDYQHTIYPSEDNFGDFATVAVKKGNASWSAIHTYPSVKFSGFTMSGQAQPQRVQLSFSTIADEMTNASAAITAAAFAGMGAAPSGNGGAMFFRNFRVWINDQGSATLATGDELTSSVTDFEFTYNRSLATDYTNTSGLGMEEPVEDGYPEVSLKLGLRHMDADSEGFLSGLFNKTAKKIKFELTGAAASAATGTVSAAAFRVEMPHALVQSPEPGSFSGPGRIGASVTFKVLGAETTSDAPGMAFAKPFKLTVVNAQGGKAVA